MSESQDKMPDELQIPRRFTIPQRIEHAVMAVLFAILAFTGLIQKYAANPAANRLIEWLGGIEPTRIIHRWAAALFALLVVYHILVMTYKMIVPRVAMAMMPRLKDFRDALHLLRYNLSLTRKPPQMPRYSFIEKLEYWSLIWGSAIMIMTGLMLWNPLFTAKYLSSQFIPAAKVAHGAEAILAVLAIIVWHFYHVHIKSFNKSMFTGKLTRQQMEEEHSGELKQLIAGEMRPVLARREMRRRALFFMPIAIAIAAAGVGAFYWAAAAKNRAISNLPLKTRPSVSGLPSKAASPATHSAIVSAPLIPHPIESRQQCKNCHAFLGAKPEPADHVGRPSESCRICHQSAPKPKRGQAGMIPHPIADTVYRDCARCHSAEKIKPYPADHGGFTVESCAACHPKGDAQQIPEAGAKPRPIPHGIDGEVYQDCARCHQPGGIRHLPVDHADYDPKSCSACHQPASGSGE